MKPRSRSRSSSSSPITAETSVMSMSGLPGRRGSSTRGRDTGACRPLRTSRLSVDLNVSPVRARSCSMMATTSSSSVMVVRMMP